MPAFFFFFFSSRRRHTRSLCDWSSDVCSSDLQTTIPFQIQLFQNRKFRAGRIHTHFVDQEFDFKDVKEKHHEKAAILAAALAFLRREQMTPKYASPMPISPWQLAFH